MKKLFFIAAIAGAALVSCTKNELAPSATEQHEITFTSPAVGAQTKVVNGAIGATYNTEETFNVWAVYSNAAINNWSEGSAYITNKTVAYNGTGWGFTPAYYWPATGFLSFVALSPSITNTTSYDGSNGFKIQGWSQGADENAIVDLMYSDENKNNAKAYYNADGEENGTDKTDGDGHDYKGVDIKFNHALSYLVFEIQTKDDYSNTTSFKLNKITLSGVYTTGDFVQNPTGENPNWNVDVTTPAKVGTYVAYNNTTGLPFSEEAVPAIAETGHEIILLPQTLTAEQQKLTINYQITTTDASEWFNQEQTVDLKLDGAVEEWEMGKKYTYTIIIGANELIFDPAVTDWDPEEGGEIEL